jgi:hypothetical protein
VKPGWRISSVDKDSVWGQPSGAKTLGKSVRRSIGGLSACGGRGCLGEEGETGVATLS